MDTKSGSSSSSSSGISKQQQNNIIETSNRLNEIVSSIISAPSSSPSPSGESVVVPIGTTTTVASSSSSSSSSSSFSPTATSIGSISTIATTAATTSTTSTTSSFLTTNMESIVFVTILVLITIFIGSLLTLIAICYQRRNYLITSTKKDAIGLFGKMRAGIVAVATSATSSSSSSSSSKLSPNSIGGTSEKDSTYLIANNNNHAQHQQQPLQYNSIGSFGYCREKSSLLPMNGNANGSANHHTHHHHNPNSQYSSSSHELDDVRLHPQIDQILSDTQWVDDATGLIPHCLAVLKGAHHLTERLVAVTMSAMPRFTEAEQRVKLGEIGRIAPTISPRVNDVVEAMYPPLDPRLLESRCLSLLLSVSRFAIVITYVCGIRGQWIDDELRGLELQLKILREAGQVLLNDEMNCTAPSVMEVAAMAASASTSTSASSPTSTTSVVADNNTKSTGATTTPPPSTTMTIAPLNSNNNTNSKWNIA